MSIEYIFFNESFRDRFVQFALSQGITAKVRKDDMDGFLAEFPGDLDDELLQAIDAKYEFLMEAQETQAEAEEGWLTSDAMGVEIKLADARHCVVRIPAKFIRRLTENFSPEEIHALVSAIAHDVENPDEGPICKMR